MIDDIARIESAGAKFRKSQAEAKVAEEKVIESDPLEAVERWLKGEEINLDPILPALKKLSNLQYEGVRKKVSDKGKIRATVLDQEVRPKKTELKKNIVTFVEVEQWPEAVNGRELFEEISAWLDRYVHLKKDHSKIIALYALATHFIEGLFFAPILAVLSPAMRCGKSTLLELIKYIVRRGFLTSGSGITSAVLFRLNDSDKPTWLIDEAERLSAKDGDKEIISLLNAGYRRGATVQRCVGENFEVKNFNAHGFKVTAAIGRLWGTLMDRAITISMERKPETIKKDRFVSREVEKEGAILASKISRFVQDNLAEIESHEKQAPRPKALNDRACDNWSALFAVAGLISQEILKEAVNLAKSIDTDEPAGLGEMLLTDIRTVFESLNNPATMSTSNLIDQLKMIEGGPWADYRGKGLSPHNLSKILKDFKLGPLKIRKGKNTFRGWELSELKPVFDQYIPQSPSQEAEHPEHPEQTNNINGFERFGSMEQSGTHPEQNEECSISYPEHENIRNTGNPHKQASVPMVPDVPGKTGYNEEGVSDVDWRVI